jgi:perosamine synthetase
VSATLAIHGGSPVRSRPFPPQATIDEDERRAVLDVLESGVLSQFLGEWSEDFMGGPRVRACEEAFAQRLGAEHAVAVNSATTGLHVALAAAGIGPGDEVIVSPYTMSASAAVIVLQNAIPVFADIEDETFGLDPASVEERITEHTRALMVTHLFGHPARMDGLLEIARRHDLVIVEDAAQSIGATWNGRETGAIGTAGVLSLNYHKIVHSGEGGIVLTDDPQIATRARLSRNHGEVVVEETDLPDIVNTIGSNFRMTEIDAAIAITQLGKLDRLLAGRREIAGYLSTRLAELPGIAPAVVRAEATHSFYVFPMTLKPDELKGVRRPDVARALAAEGVPVSEGYVKPLYLQAMYQQRIARGSRGCPWTCGHWQGEVSYAPGICPVTERLYERDLLLADVCRHPLTLEDAKDVADAFEKVMTNVDAIRDGSTR